MTDFSTLLPPMLFGEELREVLTVLPEYDNSVRELDAGARFLKLADIYKVFIANDMAAEIYYRLYSMVSISLQKKGTAESVGLLNAVHRGIGVAGDDEGCAGFEYKGVATRQRSASAAGPLKQICLTAG